MAELYALILSEIDLSVGFVGAVGAAIALALMGAPQNWPWWAALIVGMAACAVIGALQGLLITRLRIPSFVVTLAGLLGWQGVLIYVFDVDKGAVGGVISISNNVIDDLVSGSMSPAAGWILLIVTVGLYATFTLLTRPDAGPRVSPCHHAASRCSTWERSPRPAWCWCGSAT